jgi:hypothetical protein
MADLRISTPIAALMLAFFLASGAGAVAQTGGFPFGTYKGGPFTMTFEEGGEFRVVHSSGAEVTGTYKISVDRIEFTDQAGEFLCQGPAGKYTWKLDRDNLILSVVEDECDGRKEALTSGPLVRKNGK